MAINLNNSVVNIQGTPGFITDLFANQPSASSVASGTIFVASDTGAIYQSNGVTWQTIGGGGSPQDIDLTLGYGNIAYNKQQIFDNLTGVTNTIDTLSYQINNTTTFRLTTLNDNTLVFQDTNNNLITTYTQNLFTYNNIITGNFFEFIFDEDNFYTSFSNNQFGITIDFPNYTAKFGDFNNVVKGDYIVIDNTFEFIKTYMDNTEFGLFIDRTVVTYLGDYNGNYNNTRQIIDDTLQNIQLITTNACLELDTTTTITRFGDLLNIQNGNYFGLDDTNNKLIGSTNLLSGTSSGNSGQHIKINIGGTDYKIRLELP